MTKLIEAQNKSIDNHNQTVTDRDKVIVQLNQTIGNRDQTINNRNQTIVQLPQHQETPFYLKCQFLVGYLLYLLSYVIALALGWKQPNDPGYFRLLDSSQITSILAGIWAVIILYIVYLKHLKQRLRVWRQRITAWLSQWRVRKIWRRA